MPADLARGHIDLVDRAVVDMMMSSGAPRILCSWQEGTPGEVLLQAGSEHESRCAFMLPDVRSPSSAQAFVSQVQSYATNRARRLQR